MHVCRFCGRECKNQNSLRNHERLCNSNPNQQVTPFMNDEFQKNKGGKISNGSIKAREEGRVFIVSEETRKKQSLYAKSRSASWHEENGKRISDTVKKKVDAGEWHTSLAKHMHIDYNGVDLHGSWELRYAQYLDLNGIEWERNKVSFPYDYDGKTRRYTPDFFLPSSNEYIEVKGYKTAKDEAKWSQFPSHLSLVVLMKADLEDLLQIKL